MKLTIKFFRETGRKGGQTTAQRYTTAQRIEWGKKGGRPKKQTEATANPQPEAQK